MRGRRRDGRDGGGAGGGARPSLARGAGLVWRRRWLCWRTWGMERRSKGGDAAMKCVVSDGKTEEN